MGRIEERKGCLTCISLRLLTTLSLPQTEFPLPHPTPPHPILHPEPDGIFIWRTPAFIIVTCGERPIRVGLSAGSCFGEGETTWEAAKLAGIRGQEWEGPEILSRQVLSPDTKKGGLL